LLTSKLIQRLDFELNPDHSMINHLFIGLGGQGGKTLGEIRKVVANRESDVRTLGDRGLKWDFLYIDSSRDVSNTRKTWTHFGENLALDPSSFLYLNDNGGEIDAASMARLPDVAPWIGDPAKLDAFLQGNQGIVGANQRRRLGRLLFARNADRIRKAVCEDKITPMLGASNRCAIHIFASLAGGTGSGGIVDLVTMLRTEFPNASTDDGFPIFLYLYVTDRQFEEAQVGYFHENQAAVIRDLNALACGNYRPNMLGSAINGEPFKGGQAFTQIVLSSQLNGKNQLLSLEQQHQIFAEAAFERIYCFTTGNLNTDQQKALTGEDKIASYQGEPAKIPLRSYRFGSSGMRRWEVPIDEVRELLASDLLGSSLKTLLYQNWSSTLGAASEKLRSNIQGYSECLEEILSSVTAEKIAQSELPSLIDKINTDINRFHDGKRREGFRDLDLDDYEHGVRERYSEHLADRGVNPVFNEFANLRGMRIERIKSSIHGIVKRAWARPSKSLGLIYVPDLLIEAQSKFRKDIDGAKQSTAADNALLNRMQLRKTEWTKLTFLSRPIKQDQFARAHQADLLSLLRQDLKHRAGLEDVELLESIVRTLGQMASDYKLATDILADKCKSSSKRFETLLIGLKALKSEDAANLDGRIANKAEFSITELESYIGEQRLEKDQLHNTCDELVSKAIDEVLGDDQLIKLGRLSEAQKVKFDEITEFIIFRRTAHIHDSIVERTHREPVLSGHILDILQNRFNDDSDCFKSELKAFIDSSASSIHLSSTEIQPKSLRSDSGMPSMPRQVLVIGIPSGHPFGSRLRSLVGPLMDAGSITYHSVYEHEDPTQIRMLTMTYWMAARYAKVVQGLETIYNRSLAADRDGDKRYFTNIDLSGEKESRPAILLPTAGEAQSQMRAALWLGNRLHAPGTALQLIQESTGGVVLVEIGDQGISPVIVGESLEMLNTNVDVTTASRVITAVESSLAALSSGDLDELRSQIKEIDAEKLLEGGVARSEFIAWTKDRDNLFKFLAK
jgi:hypothetical protein